MPLRTLLLWNPGSARLADEPGNGADILVVDPGEHENGPALAARAVLSLRGHPRRPPVYVRIGPLAGGRVDAELDAIMPDAPHGILLPGAVGLRDVDHLGAKLALREASHGLRDGATEIIAVADNADGARSLQAFHDPGPRLAGIACDPERLAQDLGCAPDAPAVAHVASLTVLTAAGAGVPAIYVLPPGDRDEDLAATLGRIRRQGFAAVILSDAGEVASANEVFGSR